MEHISNLIDQALKPEVNQPERTTSLKVYERTLNDQDDKMLALKYAAPQIWTMQDAEVIKACKTLLLKIHIITGWVIPGNELMVLLIDQFSKKLAESYGMLNVDEIEFAFRNGGTVIEDWGKEMNLNLIDKVLIPYVNQRLEVSAKEERMKAPPVQKILTDKELEDIVRGDIENFYQKCRAGKIPHSLPDYFKEVLVKDGFIKDDESMSNFIVQRLGKGYENIYVPA